MKKFVLLFGLFFIFGCSPKYFQTIQTETPPASAANFRTVLQTSWYVALTVQESNFKFDVWKSFPEHVEILTVIGKFVQPTEPTKADCERLYEQLKSENKFRQYSVLSDFAITGNEKRWVQVPIEKTPINANKKRN